MESLGILNVTDNKKNIYCIDGNDALEIKLVRNPEDLQSQRFSFKPDMCHQVFGESTELEQLKKSGALLTIGFQRSHPSIHDGMKQIGNSGTHAIFGYKGLKIKLYYAAGNLTTYIGIEYEEKISTPGIEPDNVLDMLRNAIQSRFETNITVFERLLQEDDTFHPHGNLTNAFSIGDGLESRTFEVYVNDTSDANFLEYHSKVQTFVILYIDAANYVDPDEGNWKFFLLYEKYLSSNMVMKYGVVGYASVYEYYAYPSHIRPRVSQVVILPPFRCTGLCSKLLNSIYSYYQTNRKVVDITVESPSPDFQRVRDFVDCKNCMNLDAFSPAKLKHGFSEEQIRQCKERFKINKKQARRIYEILRLKYTNIHNDEEYNAYLAEIKDRLCRPNKKRIMKRRFWSYFASDPDEFYVPALPDNGTLQDCDEDIEDEVLELKEQYDLVISRLNRNH